MRKKIIIFIIAISVLIISAVFYGCKQELLSYSLFILPLEFIGSNLRSLSLSSPFLNVIAIILYILISLIPLYLIIYKTLKKKFIIWEALFLILLTICLFFVNYYLINPHLLKGLYNNFNIIPEELVESSLNIIKISLLSIFYSVLIIYIGLKLIFIAQNDLRKTFNFIIYIIIGIILYSELYVSLSTVIRSFKNDLQNVEVYFLVINYIFRLFVSGFIVFIIYHIFKLINYVMDTDINYKTVDESKRLCKYSKIYVMILLFGMFIINLIQFIFLREMENLKFSLILPIKEILFILIILILSNYFIKTYDINEENKLTI